MKQLFLFLLLWQCTTTIQAQTKDCLDSKDQSAQFMIGKWEGTFKQYACGINNQYPMIVEISEVTGKKFRGYFYWNNGTDMDNRTVLEGEVKNNKVYFYEGKILEGEKGGLVLDGVYESKLSNCNELTGFWKITQANPQCPDLKPNKKGGDYTIRKNETYKVVEEIAERKVIVKQQLSVTTATVKIEIWDHQQEDGDIVSLRLNGENVVDKIRLLRKKYEKTITLQQGTNTLALDAINLGSIPPNTAAIRITSDGKLIKEVVLKSDMNTSEAITIVRE